MMKVMAMRPTLSRPISRLCGLILILLLASVAGGCQGGRHPQKPPGQAPRLGLDRGVEWQPGLVVVYLPGKFRHTREMPTGENLHRLGRPGPPIAAFNHSFGRGEVFASGRARAIGLEANGFIHLDRTGTYRFKALSNDGIRVWVADRLVVDDGEWHSSGDRFSTPETMENPQAGWAAMRLRYFQRKGTATLKLLWQPPGSDDFSVIPAAAYAHGPPAD
jgi:hypothetical protein